MATVLIPGSFDPLHLGHIDVVDQAVELFGDVVLGILVNFD
jgi:pantetheine-phosphate adenylyltransferase